MRPANQFPLSLNEMNFSPSSLIPDSPPNPAKREVRNSPLRYSSAPNRTRERSLRSNEAIGRALTSIDTGAVTNNSSAGLGFAGDSFASCPHATSDIAIAESPAAVEARKRRREGCTGLFLFERRRALRAMSHFIALRMQPAPG